MTYLQSAPGDEPVIVEGHFDAPIKRVFQAWTTPDAVKAWFGTDSHQLANAEIDLRVGGAYRFEFKGSDDTKSHFEGEYLTIKPEQQLVFSWRHVVTGADGSRDETAVSQVTVNFDETNGQTRIHLQHEAIQHADGRKGVGGGWEDSFKHLQTLFSPGC